MSVLAPEFLSLALEFVGEKAGDAIVEQICGDLVGSIFGGGNDDNPLDAEILAKLNQILSDLQQVQTTLQQIEGEITHISLDIKTAVIQQNIDAINALHDSYFDTLKGMTAASKGTDDTSKTQFASFRERLTELGNNVKNTIPTNLNTIHDFVAGQKVGGYIDQESQSRLGSSKDIIDYYCQLKLILIKVVVAETKGVHLLRLVSADDSKQVNFPDGPDAIKRALANIETQDQTLQFVIGGDLYPLITAILAAAPDPTPVCISMVQARGLWNGGTAFTSRWCAGSISRLWYVEPVDSYPIVTDGSRPNQFRLKCANGNGSAYMWEYNGGLGETLNASQTSTWAIILNQNGTCQLQSQSDLDSVIVYSPYQVFTNGPYTEAVSIGSRGSSIYGFILQLYQGAINDMWPRGFTSMKVGERLIPGAYLESKNKQWQLGFVGEKFGVWDTVNKAWSGDYVMSCDLTSHPYADFSPCSQVVLSQDSGTVGQFGSSLASDAGAEVIITNKGYIAYKGGDGSETYA
ncbi:hypothetical protein FPOA_03869 [Fusarium poae]|uniref:Uncharacterized protein n=1 Tax=Fusarium poae TaxID=36050 RepID=A0A1B8AS54_FUSPO|nr:hypothetical protein FPOA_03869 [Fusarium poae]